jgi:hypothetical protein
LAFAITLAHAAFDGAGGQTYDDDEDVPHELVAATAATTATATTAVSERAREVTMLPMDSLLLSLYHAACRTQELLELSSGADS